MLFILLYYIYYIIYYILYYIYTTYIYNKSYTSPCFSNSARFSVYKGARFSIKTVDVSNIKTVVLNYQIFNNNHYTLTTLYYSSFCDAKLNILNKHIIIIKVMINLVMEIIIMEMI